MIIRSLATLIGLAAATAEYHPSQNQLITKVFDLEHAGQIRPEHISSFLEVLNKVSAKVGVLAGVNQAPNQATDMTPAYTTGAVLDIQFYNLLQTASLNTYVDELGQTIDGIAAELKG